METGIEASCCCRRPWHKKQYLAFRNTTGSPDGKEKGPPFAAAVGNVIATVKKAAGHLLTDDGFCVPWAGGAGAAAGRQTTGRQTRTEADTRMTTVSRYNHLHPWINGYYIAFNARSGAVALMTEENRAVYDTLTAKLAASPDSELTAAERELLGQMEYGRFAYAGEYDEREAIHFQHDMDRYDKTTLGLVIAPTMACNMACPYCYEANKQGRMTPETIAAVVKFVEDRAPHLRLFSTTWYGGEPLLALNIIEELSKSFMDIAKENKIGYSSAIISNGYLLTPETVDRLVQWQVASVQVTIDGPARFHNVKRPLKNGRPSFDTIVQNVAYAVKKMRVNIRVNLDKSFTRDMIAELLQELKAAGLHDKAGVYFGQIEPSAQVCSNISESCYETADFSSVETDYFRMLLQEGFRVEKLPAPISTFCMAQMTGSFLIDPPGNLYRCFNHVANEEQSMGNISKPIDYQHPNFTRLFRFDPFRDPACSECDLLPVCMGGCPSRRSDRQQSGASMCESWKHNLRPMLEIIARSRQAEQQRKAAETAKE